MTEPETSTAVAKVEPEGAQLLGLAQTPEERAFAFNTMTQVRQSRMIREAAKALAATSWGKELSDVGRAAVARYAYESGTDPVRHWIVLGGNLYDTNLLWLDLATSQPDYEGYECRHINDDDRLDDAERTERRGLRAKYNLPDDVKGAAIVTVWKRLPTGQIRAFTGANHAGNRRGYSARLKKETDILDPIGEENPGKTAETRAFRRAAKRCWPIWRFKRDIPENEGLNVAEIARDGVNDLLTAEQTEAAKAQPGKLDNVAQFVEVPGSGGMQIRDTTGDRLPPESIPTNPYEHPDEHLEGAVEGVQAVESQYGEVVEDEDAIREEDKELAKERTMDPGKPPKPPKL